MSLVSDVLDDALIYVGALGAGETVAPEDQALALRVTNRMFDSWAARKLSLIGISYNTFAFSGASSYTYGTGETWNAPRPIKIKAAASLAANGTSQPVAIVPAEEWAKIVDQTRTGIFAEKLFWDTGDPTGNISVTPRPAAGNLALWTYQPIPYFVNPTDTVVLPPGAERALVVIVALELCIPFGRPTPDSLPGAAQDAMTTLERIYSEITGEQLPPVPVSPPVQLQEAA